MAKRYLGGGVSFEQKDVYQEFSEDGGGGGGGGSTTLSGLTDVDISEPTNGQTLVYNATSEKWENGAGGGGGGALVVRGVAVGEDVTLDHTYAEIVSAAPLVYYALEPAPNRTSFMPLNAFGAVDERYVVRFGEEAPFTTDSEDGYPVSHGIN